MIVDLNGATNNKSLLNKFTWYIHKMQLTWVWQNNPIFLEQIIFFFSQKKILFFHFIKIYLHSKIIRLIFLFNRLLGDIST